MRDYPEDKKPNLLLVVKDSDELEEVWDLWDEIKLEVYENRIFEEVPTCFGITEKFILYNMKKNLPFPFQDFTDFLISSKIHDNMLINYISKNIRRK